MSASLVSIALVTRNGVATLPPLLDALARQRVDFPVEIVVVDSGSTDGSAELLARSVDRFVTIPHETFNHGLTRNLAVERSRGWALAIFSPRKTTSAGSGILFAQRSNPPIWAFYHYG